MTTDTANTLALEFNSLGRPHGVTSFVALTGPGDCQNCRLFFVGRTGTHSIDVACSDVARARLHFAGFLARQVVAG